MFCDACIGFCLWQNSICLAFYSCMDKAVNLFYVSDIALKFLNMLTITSLTTVSCMSWVNGSKPFSTLSATLSLAYTNQQNAYAHLTCHSGSFISFPTKGLLTSETCSCLRLIASVLEITLLVLRKLFCSHKIKTSIKYAFGKKKIKIKSMICITFIVQSALVQVLRVQKKNRFPNEIFSTPLFIQYLSEHMKSEG